MDHFSIASVDQSCFISPPFVVSLFYGKTKPINVNEFLEPFVPEMTTLELEGIKVEKVFYNTRIRCIVADVPACSLLK